MARLTPAGAVASWVRKYPLAPRYQRELRVTLTAEDGTRLAAARLAGPPDPPFGVVVAHGFLNWSRTPAIHSFAQRLAQHVPVVVPDLRGHGRSAGVCEFGKGEPLDVKAAVEALPEGLPVVTIGVSLGGAAVLLHAGIRKGVAAAVAVSAPAFWETRRPGSSRVQRYVTSRAGRATLYAISRTRIGTRCDDLPEPAAVAAAIAPALTIVVHDPDDWYFGPEHAEQIHGWANDPKELWWYPGGGHGTDLLTTAFADRLLARLTEHVASAQPAPRPSPSP
jgi:pimeloyl-ACP methyl ester carboxylesterase